MINQSSGKPLSGKNIDLEDIREEENSLLATVSNINDQKPIICKQHNDFVSLYCCNCKFLLCVSCVYNSDCHLKHVVIPLRDSLDIIQKENILFKEEARQKYCLIEKSIDACRQNNHLLQIGEKQLLEQMRAQFSEIHHKLAEREKRLEEEILSLFEQRKTEYVSTISDLEYLKNCMHQYQDFDRCENKNIEIYMFQVFSMIRKTIQNIDFNFKQYTFQDLNIVNFSNKELILQEIDQFARITHRLRLRDSKKERSTSIKKGTSSPYQQTLSPLVSQKKATAHAHLLPKMHSQDSYIKNIVQSSRYASRNSSLQRSTTPPIQKSQYSPLKHRIKHRRIISASYENKQKKNSIQTILREVPEGLEKKKDIAQSKKNILKFHTPERFQYQPSYQDVLDQRFNRLFRQKFLDPGIKFPNKNK